jgi:hypothetical protein
MSDNMQARRKALFARTGDAALIEAVKTLEALLVAGNATQEHIMSRAWTIDELELRFPAASDAVEAAFYAAETAPGKYVEVDYVAVLLANIKI